MSENGLHKIPNMRTALEAIQELHKVYYQTCADEVYELNPLCESCGEAFPCRTRRLADQGLGGGQDG